MLQLFGRLHSRQCNPVERASGSLLSAEEDVAQIAVPRETKDGRYPIISYHVMGEWISSPLSAERQNTRKYQERKEGRATKK